MIAVSFWAAPFESLVGCSIILTGIPAYLLGYKWKKPHVVKKMLGEWDIFFFFNIVFVYLFRQGQRSIHYSLLWNSCENIYSRVSTDTFSLFIQSVLKPLNKVLIRCLIIWQHLNCSNRAKANRRGWYDELFLLRNLHHVLSEDLHVCSWGEGEEWGGWIRLDRLNEMKDCVDILVWTFLICLHSFTCDLA